MSHEVLTYLMCALSCVLAYLICGFPSAYVIGEKLGHVDVRTVGSGNVGTTNIARSVGKDALATEDASSEAAQTYANVLVVKEGNENDPAIQALYAALTSDKVKDYINKTYDGAVVPIF